MSDNKNKFILQDKIRLFNTGPEIATIQANKENNNIVIEILANQEFNNEDNQYCVIIDFAEKILKFLSAILRKEPSYSKSFLVKSNNINLFVKFCICYCIGNLKSQKKDKCLKKWKKNFKSDYSKMFYD